MIRGVLKKNAVSSKNNNKILNDSINDSEVNSLKIYPNPFYSTLNIDYNISKTENIRISIYNTLSMKIASVVNEIQQEGLHHVVFDGSKLEAGIYYCNLETDNYKQTKKIVLIK